MISRKWIFLLAVIELMHLSCSVERIAGNGSQTGNPVITGMLYTADSVTPACNAHVYVLKKNVRLPSDFTIVQNPDTVSVTMTGCDGRFTIDSIGTGQYVIECTDGGNNIAFIDSVTVYHVDSTLQLSPAVLKPAGAIKGTINLLFGGDPRKVLVIIPTLGRITAVDSVGFYRFELLAEGRYSFTFLPTLDNYGVVDTTDIPVFSNDTTNLDVISLPFTGIPTVRNLSILYDTLQQRVILFWNRAGTTLVKSYNVYRRDADPVSAISKQLNFYPVIDTFFIDSSCEKNRSYEYRVTAVDTNTNEGPRSSSVSTHVALYNVIPQNVRMIYDTLKQLVTLHWSNPDTAFVRSFNVYRRNVRLNETFWTPFNNSPIYDTSFIDSTFLLCPIDNGLCDDSLSLNSPAYEYCVAALIHEKQEGERSVGLPLRVSTRYLTPANVSFLYDTLEQTVLLRWSRPEMSLVSGFSIYRRNLSNNENLFSRINSKNVIDTFFTDSSGGQNQFYEYRIASVLQNKRAEVKSAGINIHIAASFVEDTTFILDNYLNGMMVIPKDIAVSKTGDVLIVNQGTTGSILVFDSAMSFKRQIGAGILDNPFKVGLDDQGKMYAASYSRQRDCSSVFIFDEKGIAIDTILDSMVINDIDVKDSSLCIISEGRFISVHTTDGLKKRSWQVSGQYSGQCVVYGDENQIFVSTGLIFPDKNNIIVFDSLGNKKSSITLPFYPHAMAYDTTRQLLYVICTNGKHESVLHVIDTVNVERARYKIKNTDQNISIGIQKNGNVIILINGEGNILRLKPIVAL